jgi:gamma-glutamyltranspeptidase/glutathione hydrolase
VLAPRVHHQHLPDRISHEPKGLPKDVADALRAMGHDVVEGAELSGDVQAVLRRSDGLLEGQSDPRRGGAVAGY